MRHTNLSSAVNHAKKLAKEKGRPHFAHGASGRYRVSDKKPEDTSFVQATPSGGEWSHKMNAATKTFTKSRIFGGVTMEDVEREWERGTMKELIEKAEKDALDAFDPGAKEYVAGLLDEIKSEVTGIARDMKAGKRKQAAQGIQDLLSKVQSVIFNAYGLLSNSPDVAAAEEAQAAIKKARQAVYRLEKAVK